VEGRDLSFKTDAIRSEGLEIGKPINSDKCSEAAEGVARASVEVLSESRMRGNLPVRFDERGCENGDMVEPVRHRRTKGAETDMFEPKDTRVTPRLYTFETCRRA